MGLAHELHPALLELARTAQLTLAEARVAHSREALQVESRMGADGTPTMRIDDLIEERLLDVAAGYRVNVLSEEAGFLDNGSAITLVMDPVDGSANAAAGVPLSCLSIAVAEESLFTQALTCALDTGDIWCASSDGRTEGPRGDPLTPSTCHDLEHAALSLLRPHAGTSSSTAWWTLAQRARRLRVLSCSTLDIALVASGAVDAFADPGSDTHRLVDLAAGVVFAAAGSGHLADLHDRPISFDPDLTKRWSGLFAATPQLLDQLRATVERAAALPLPD